MAFSLEDTIKTFTYHQALVVYWFCHELSNGDIADRFGYEKSWVVWQMSQVYFKIGLDRKDANGRKLHWSERRKILQEKVCPIIRRLTNDDPELLERFPLIPPNVLEGNIVDLRPEIPVPPSESVVPLPEPLPEPPRLPPDDQTPPSDPPPDFYPIQLYNAWLAVLEDDKHDDPPPPPPIIVGPERRGIMWGRLLGLGLAVLLGCAVVGVLAYWFGTRQNFPPPQSTPVPSTTREILITETLAVTATLTLTAPPSETLAPTSSPTSTSTVTPIPTDTKSPLDLRVGDVLEDNRVSLRLTNIGYGELYDRIGSRRAPISYYFDFVNHSGETIVLQFDQYDFESTDDRGQTTNCSFFHISGAGPAVNEPLTNGATRQIIARCGDGQLDPAVNMYTLTIHPFSSLPESKWIVEIPR